MKETAEKRNITVERQRMAQIAGDQVRGGAPRPQYTLSYATAEPLRRKLRGSWKVVEHRQGSESYVERFCSRTLKGGVLRDPFYRAVYEFKDGICLKRVEIEGLVAGDESASYRYRMGVALTWDLSAVDTLAISAHLGYQTSELAGVPAALKELESGGESVSVNFHFEGDRLVLEEGDDYKVLERLRDI